MNSQNIATNSSHYSINVPVLSFDNVSIDKGTVRDPLGNFQINRIADDSVKAKGVRDSAFEHRKQEIKLTKQNENENHNLIENVRVLQQEISGNVEGKDISNLINNGIENSFEYLTSAQQTEMILSQKKQLEGEINKLLILIENKNGTIREYEKVIKAQNKKIQSDSASIIKLQKLQQYNAILKEKFCESAVQIERLQELLCLNFGKNQGLNFSELVNKQLKKNIIQIKPTQAILPKIVCQIQQGIQVELLNMKQVNSQIKEVQKESQGLLEVVQSQKRENQGLRKDNESLLSLIECQKSCIVRMEEKRKSYEINEQTLFKKVSISEQKLQNLAKSYESILSQISMKINETENISQKLTEMIQETKNKFQLIEPVKPIKDKTKKNIIQSKAATGEENALK